MTLKSQINGLVHDCRNSIANAPRACNKQLKCRRWTKQNTCFIPMYRKTSGISRTKSQNLNVSCVVLRLSSLNPLKPGVKLRMKM